MDAFCRQAAPAGVEPPPRGSSSMRRRWPFFLSLVLLCCASAHPPRSLHAGKDIFDFFHSSQFFLPSFPGVQVAHGQVVGMDLGSEFVKVALVAAGRPMEIILNAASKRKTSHAVSFADSEKRDMGDEGAAAASKRPDHVFMHSNLFLGLNAADVDSSFTVEASSLSCTRKGEKAEKEGGEGNKTEDASSSSESSCSAEEQPRFLPLKLQAEQSLLQEVGYPHAYYPYRLYADRKRHTVAFLAREGMYLSPEMVTANFLSYLRKMAAQAANVPPTAAIGVVISVPCRFSQRQRQALRDAAEIAGLRPISLVHHAAAAATQHALDTPLPSSTGSSSSNSSSSKAGGVSAAGEQSEGGAKTDAAANGGGTAAGRSTKLFVDVGSTAVDFSLVRFEPVPLTQPSKITKKAATGGDVASTSGPQTLSVQMLSCETLYGIGGHNVDIGIAELMREAFQKRYPAQGDLRQTPRALKKLLRQAVLSKHILSANKKTQFSVEGLLTTESGAELDLHELVDRSHVESVLERMQLRARMQQALQKTLQQAQLELKDIDQVELLGGGWRVPHVQQELSAVLDGRLPGMHLNGDEAMATGAAFIAANNTVTFRVKKYYLTDVTPYDYSLKITYRPSSAAAAAAAGDEAAAQQQQGEAEEQVDENSRQQQQEEKAEKETQEVVEKIVTLYARNTKFGGAPTTKTVSVRTAEDLTVELLEDGAVIETISVRGVPEAVAKQQQAAAAANRTQEAENKQRQQQQQETGGEGGGEGAAAAPEAAGSSSSKVVEVLGDPKISLVFAVDGCGVLTFDRAYASFTLQSTEEVPASPKTAAAAAESGGATAAAGSSENPAAAAGAAAAAEAEQSSSSGSNSGEAGTEAKAKKEEEKGKEDATQAAATTKIQKRKQVVEALRGEKVLALPLPLNQEEKRQLREQLLELEAADLQVHLFSEAINRLESFIYATRSALDEAPVLEVMQAEDVEKLRQRLQDDEDYLYSKAKEEGLEAVKRRQQELEDIVIPIRHRAAERTARPQAMKAVEEGLAAAASRLQRAAELLEQHKNWPPEDKIQKAQQLRENLEKWWGEKREEQEKRKDWEDPAFTRAEIRKKLRELEAALKAVEEAPKPAPPSSSGPATGGKKSSAAAAARRKRAAREAAAAGDKEKPVPEAAGPEDAEQQQQQQEGEGKEEAAEAAGAEDKKDSEFAAGEAEGGGAASVDSGSETPSQEQQQQQDKQEGGEKAEEERKQAETQQQKTAEHNDEL